VLSKLLRAKTAAVAGLTLLSIGGVAAAATGPAPTSGERAVTSASPRTPDGQVGHAQGDAATLIHGPDAATPTNGSTPGKPSDHAAAPDASGAARHGLCQAWSAGRGDENGQRADSTAFQGAGRRGGRRRPDPRLLPGGGRRLGQAWTAACRATQHQTGPAPRQRPPARERAERTADDHLTRSCDDLRDLGPFPGWRSPAVAPVGVVVPVAGMPRKRQDGR
jgi:hypothetical protein